MKLPGYYSSGEFAKKAHITKKTVRYYDEHNILKPSYVNENGARFYNDDDFARLQQILFLKYLGFSLDDIKEMTLRNTDSNVMSESLHMQLGLVEERIEQMKLMKSALQEASEVIDEGRSVDWSHMLEPYTLSMTETDKYGKPLRAQHIAEAIIDTVQRGARCAGSPEMRGRMLHQMLIASSRGGNRHVLVIEEAHDLHVQTIKSLKRFWELKDGMRRLLSIILIGQTELRGKLSNTQAEVREVVQRCDIIELPPIKDPEAYLAFRFKVAGADISNIFEPEALALLQEQLVVASSLNSNGVYLGYPLAIANLARAAMSKAYEIGESIVTGDVMRLVQPKEAGRV